MLSVFFVFISIPVFGYNRDSLPQMVEMARTHVVNILIQKDENGKYTVTAKGEKARIDGMSFPSQQNPSVMEAGSMINDGEWAYIWNGKDGNKFNLKDIQQGTDSSANSQNETTDWKNWAKSMEASGAKYDCSPTVVTDADFTPPSDVKFQDWGEMLKSIQQMQDNPSAPIDPSQFKIPAN